MKVLKKTTAAIVAATTVSVVAPTQAATQPTSLVLNENYDVIDLSQSAQTAIAVANNSGVVLEEYTGTINLNEDRTEDIEITNYNKSHSYTVTSSNDAIATAIVKGEEVVITGKSSGTAVITVKNLTNNTTANVTVTVNGLTPTQPVEPVQPQVSGIILDKTTVAINLDKDRTEDVEIENYNRSHSYTVSSSDRSVATSVLNGNDLVITGHKVGTAVFTVKDLTNNTTAQVTVTVTQSQPSTPVPDKNVVTNLEGTYYISAKHSGKVLAVENGNSETVVTQQEKTDSAYQQWTLTEVSRGVYKITNQATGLVMDVAQGVTKDGAKIIQYKDVGSTNQQWRLIANLDGSYDIVSVRSGKYLDIEGASQERGANLIQWTNHDGENQNFVLECIDSINQGSSLVSLILDKNTVSIDLNQDRTEDVEIENYNRSHTYTVTSSFPYCLTACFAPFFLKIFNIILKSAPANQSS